MKRFALVLALAATLALAGCLGGGGSEADTGSADTGSDPGATGGSGSGPGADTGSEDADAGDDHWNATLEEAPPWSAGQWWTAEVTDVNRDETYTVKQVVASQHGSSYDVGLAKQDFQDPVVIAHWPPIGELGTDLSYPIHNAKFVPVKFPLEEGKTWETSYLGQEGYTAEVTSVDGLKATIEAQNADNDTVTWTYDAEMETITHLEDFLGLEYNVVDHGHDYEGDVVVPHGKSQYIDLRLVGAFDVGNSPLPFGLTPAAPTGSIDVSEPDASVYLIAGGFGGAPGAYQETVTTPGDQTFQLTTTGTSGLEAAYHHSANATGTWELEHVAGGAGAVGTEIVAYEKLVVPLGNDDVTTSS